MFRMFSLSLSKFRAKITKLFLETDYLSFRIFSYKGLKLQLNVFCFLFCGRTSNLQLKPIFIHEQWGKCSHHLNTIPVSLCCDHHLLIQSLFSNRTFQHSLELLIKRFFESMGSFFHTSVGCCESYFTSSMGIATSLFCLSINFCVCIRIAIAS
jgi:hypothetical protein